MPFLNPLVPTPPDDSSASDDLATPEEQAAHRRRRRLVVGGLVAVALIGLAVWGAHPLVGAVKAWQARRTAAAALRLLDAGKPDEAVSKIQDALVLRGNDLGVMRNTAVLLTRLGHGREALAFWKEIEKDRLLTRDEQRDFAADLFVAGDAAEAQARLSRAWPAGETGIPADWALGMRLAMKRGDPAVAVSLARRLVEGHPAGITEAQKLDGALVLSGVGGPTERTLAEETLHSLAADGRSPVSLDALLTLARQAAQKIAAARNGRLLVPEGAVEALLDFAARIETHPQVKAAQRLLAIQMRVLARPEERTRLIQQAVGLYGHSQSNDDLAVLGAWLYAQGEFRKVLEVIPTERATSSRALYLQALDALAGLGRWEEIRDTLQSQRFTLDPMVEQMYLARCATQLHETEGAALRWNSALRAAGTNPAQLLTLGRYAQTDGAPATAEAAFRAAIKAEGHARTAYEGLLGVLTARGQTAAALATVQAMLLQWPDDPAVRNDGAYLGALLGQDLLADRNTAHELVGAEPQSLPHRVALALAELRLGHGLSALDAIKSVNPLAFAGQARFEAVRAAVLWETGFYEEARRAAAGLTPGTLLPEEWQLVKDWKLPDKLEAAETKAPVSGTP